MLINICTKFHEGTLNGLWVTERTRPYCKIYYFQLPRTTTPKICNPELQFLLSACLLLLHYICVKFHENISNCFWITEWTRLCDRRMDGQTTQAKTICLPTLKGGDIIMYKISLKRYFFETCNKWAKWQGFSVDISLFIKSCLSLLRGYIHVEKH